MNVLIEPRHKSFLPGQIQKIVQFPSSLADPRDGPRSFVREIEVDIAVGRSIMSFITSSVRWIVVALGLVVAGIFGPIDSSRT